MKKEMQPSIWPYVVGFAAAISLTLVAYWAVVDRVLTGTSLIALIMSLAVVQLVVQLVFFLHLGRGKEAKWNLAAFFFMLLILLVVVAGSLWIMHNMNYNMMSSDEMNAYMKKENSSGGF